MGRQEEAGALHGAVAFIEVKYGTVVSQFHFIKLHFARSYLVP